MSTPILATKLYIPTPQSKFVSRPRLIERLNEGLYRKLTLLSAPAGFGKTTLLAEWVERLKDWKVEKLDSQPFNLPSSNFQSSNLQAVTQIAWLSLDDGDKDLTRFLIYLVAAVQTVAPDIGEAVMSVLQSPQPPPTESILTSLLNEIAALPNDFILILDDYHVIESKPVGASPSVDEALTFLLEHQPPQMHLVITTREDPRLPLARLRGRGHLTELRLADLRFTPAEAAEFLNQVMGLDLSEADITALEIRTEGWIAGLQLAAISMQGQRDAAGFIQSFTGSHRFVLDYLIEEVLHKQPESIQIFLLRTSILDRLCGPLCDTVIGDRESSAESGNHSLISTLDSQAILEYLERANLFIVPLDNERRWYRYHTLFAELLRMRAGHTYPDQVAELHRRASDWYAGNDLPNDAVTHALAIQDWSRAADIIERFSDQWPLRGEIRTLLGWLESFPAEIWLKRVRLGVNYAWALFMANQLERADHLLDQLMPLAQDSPPIMGELFAIRVMVAAYSGDLPAVIELAQRALSLVSPEEASPRSRILLSLGVVYYELGGDISDAKGAFREAYELGKALAPSSNVGNAPLPLTALAYLAEIEWLQGNLRGASRMYEQALELAEQYGGQPSIALCFVHWGRASLLYEWNELDKAKPALQESIRIGELWKHPRFLVRPYGLSALVMLAGGQLGEASAMIRRAELITRDTHPTPPALGSLALYQIILWMAQNDFQAITKWEQSHDSTWLSQIGREREHLATVLAHTCMRRYSQQGDNAALQQARELIEPALEQTQASGLTFHVVRLLMLKALALSAQGETASAISTLKRLLALAEPENYIRSFLDLGQPMEELLSWAIESQSLSEPHLVAYGNRLLSQFSMDDRIKTSQPAIDALSEPLAERELEIIQLIALGLSNREISERLFLALSTVKGYNRIIFDKLQVQRRTEAVARARRLGLV